MNGQIIQKIESQISENIYIGASLALFSNGKWEEVYLGESEIGRATSEDLVYDIASVSKVVGVGTLLIFLLQAGKIELESPLVAYYPAFANKEVTIRQLVTHTSGIDPFIPNRDALDAVGLKAAIHQIGVTEDKSFRYTDINLILLGFLVEELYNKPLDTVLQEEIFQPWGMTETSFGPVERAVPTIKGRLAGIVHDPKANVLGVHCGSAGLFSTLHDLQIFAEHYLQDAFAADLAINLSSSKPHSVVWNLDGEEWLDHTGYTGPFIMVNRKKQKAAIFLTNRTYLYDDRPFWIEKRRELLDTIKQYL